MKVTTPASSTVDKRLKRRAMVIALAAALAMPAEGLRQLAYRDPVGILTACWGSTEKVEQRTYSMAECRARLDKDMGVAVDAVERCAPDAPDRVVVAFADAVFNMGPTIACSPASSTAARLLAAKQWDAACKQLPRWDKARVAGVMVSLPGLTKRRAAEMAVCLGQAA